MLLRKSHLLLLALCLLLCLTMAGQVSAFEYAGQAWCCDTIYYYVNPIDPSLSCGGATGPGWFQSRIATAAAAWNGLGTTFQLVDAGTTSLGCIANAAGVCFGPQDGQNTIAMSQGCLWSDPSVIAYSTWWYWTGGDTAGCIFESDICFDDNAQWFNDVGTCSGSCYDLISVAEHEIGHWIASNHEDDEALLGYRPIMFPSYTFCEMRRTVTADDSALIDWVYDPAGVIDLPARTVPVHDHPPYGTPPAHVDCAAPPCPPGPAFCDSITWQDCLLICPLSDIPFRVNVLDSCGNPVCDTVGLFLNLSLCNAQPCPGEEPGWPLIPPDSCDPTTGDHFFTVDASALICEDCEVQIMLNGAICGALPARFLDNDGDFCVTSADYVGSRICDDLDCDYTNSAADAAIHAAHLGHCCPPPSCPPGPAFCDSIIPDPCLVICPASDIVWSVIVKDSCGNPICDMTGTWLDFSSCPAIPCPGEEPNWPLVFPDSCDVATGRHYFTVDAGFFDPGGTCDCYPTLFINGQPCRDIPARFLDITGDLCVTDADWWGVAPCNDYNCDGAIDSFDSLFHQSHLTHCCGSSCPPGPAFCDSIIPDPCLVICPASDIVWSVIVMDSCGNPICDIAGTWLDFSACSAIPCPGEEPNWPLVFPDSCDPATGRHYFTVDAGFADAVGLCDCDPILFINGQPCRGIPARFLDITGDLCVTADDWWGVAPCNDYNCDGVIDTFDSLFHVSHLDHCCGSDCPPGPPFCDSVTTDPCLVICPLGDIVYTVNVKDSCGNPICDLDGTWLDFSGCEAQPCPYEEPFWPLVYPDSCDPATGDHFFSIAAGALGCIDCQIPLFIDSVFCRTVIAKFLDVDGDLCVFPPDWSGSAICNDYDCDGSITAADQGFWNSHLDHCCPPPCLPGPPFCDSITTDSCLVICPLSDIVYTVTVKDSCGNPICDTNFIYLDFSGCNAQPCPFEEPNWPLVYPDSCDPATGEHFFTVDAGLMPGADPCPDCEALLMVNGIICRSIPARFLDINGDLCVTQADWLGAWPCNDYDCDGTITTNDQAIHTAHLTHCCPAPCLPGPPFCDSTETDSCLLFCPIGDAVFTVILKDSCGNLICDETNTWLDFSSCPDAIPCPGEEPNWPLVYPDTCDPVSGAHLFTVAAGMTSCVDCDVALYVNGVFCRWVSARSFDVDGDLCVDSTDWLGLLPCNDYNCDGVVDAADSLIHLNHQDHCCDPQGAIRGQKFEDLDCDGIRGPGETYLSGWTINLYQYGMLQASTITDASGSYVFANLCPGTYRITETVPTGWVQTSPPTVLHIVELLCGQIVSGLDFGNRTDTCAGIWAVAWQVDGTVDNFVGPEPASPGADLIPLLSCPLGYTNMFDVPLTNQCFGHTFNHWDSTCCVLGATLCLRVKATGVIPGTDDLAFAENGSFVWSITMDSLQSFATGGLDTTWSTGEILQVCLDLENLPPHPTTGVTNVLAALADGDFDIRFQDDTEVDWLELRVETCCSCCNHDGIRGDVDYNLTLDVADLTYLVAYLFLGGPAPPCLAEADVDGNGTVDVADLTYLVAYLFLGGPAPVPCL